MTSLTDVYEGDAGRVASRRRKLLGTGLFLAGAATLVGAIAVATPGWGYEAMGELQARELGGIMAGVGLQAVLLGVFAVLPASWRVRAAAVIGTGISLLGIALFQHAYPYQWVEAAPLFALVTTTVYFFGVITTFWCLFVALATFKTRNDPGGTARMEITEEGTIRLVEDAPSFGGLGGVGFFGKQPDGTVETQTNTASAGGPGATAVSDGGSTATDSVAEVGTAQPEPAAGPDNSGSADAQSDSASEVKPDPYCGNCRHFRYVSADGDQIPYCGFHGRELDDMDPCPAWLQ